MASPVDSIDQSGAPWKPTASIFILTYAASFVAAAICSGWLESTLFNKKLPTATASLPICLVAVLGGLWRLLEDVTPFHEWWVRRIGRRLPRWYVLFVAGVFGGLAGILSAALAWVATPWQKWGWIPLLPLLLGPVSGIIWLSAWRPPRLQDPDYDDVQPSRLMKLCGQLVDLPTLAATESFGRRLGTLLFPNAVVALIGPLGAGKTHLSRAIAEGLGIVNPAAVTSPTFTLIHEYPARLPIYHFDAYRLKGPNEFLDLGVTEYYEAGGVCLIEWADKVEAALPAERLTIRLVPVDENRRRAEVVAVGEKYDALARALSPEGAAS